MARASVNSDSCQQGEHEQMKCVKLRRWAALAVALAASAVCWAGCGPQELPAGSLTGKVSLKGEPLSGGMVTIINSDTGIGASGEIDSSGRFRIDSARTGTYQVAIQPPAAPTPDEMAAGAKPESSPIPPKYQDPQTSGLTATVNEGSNEANFDLES